jgi:hypothetical protein
MRYWMTTHWPRCVDEPIGEPHNGAWVSDKHRAVITRIAPGDQVFIYESRSGPAVVRTHLDGPRETIRRQLGREGVVALVEVTQAAYEP